jgi:hypothetical protein
MKVHRRAASLGVLLVLPLVVAVAWSFAFTASCEYDCGDQGGRGLFLLVLLCTPPAAVGVLMLARAGGRRSHRLARLVTRLIVGGVVLCTLVLIGVSIAASVAAVDQLIHPESGHAPALFWLIVATVLIAMATTAVLALSAAWRKRR